MNGWKITIGIVLVLQAVLRFLLFVAKAAALCMMALTWYVIRAGLPGKR
jgi:hypothetical protein